MRDFSQIKDRFGGIDKEILPLVTALNFIGLKTIGSCSGHKDKKRLLPVPYVNLYLGNASDRTHGKWTEKVSRKVYLSKLLREFYKNRFPEDNVKIRITSRKDMLSRIYSGGQDFTDWVKHGNNIAKRIEKGLPIDHLIQITPKQQKHCAKTLPVYQKEMKAFAKFLFKEHASKN